MTRFDHLDAAEYQELSAIELGRRVAAGVHSPVQLAEIAVALATEMEPELNAYAVILESRARQDAAKLEAQAKIGELRGPLHGVPIAVKDNLLYQGVATRKGSRTTGDTPAPCSSPMVERLLAAGTVIIGKTTTAEFGWKGTGSSPLTGVTRNPWNTGRNSGGSSAGAGSTVGAGAVPIAVGTDAGGSIRIPAAFCGTVGLKPTLGAIPVWPGTVNESLSHAGPLTRSVADARAVLWATRGPDPRDPQSFYAAPTAPVPARPLRVGIVECPFGIAPLPHVAAVVDPALAKIARSESFAVEHVTLPADLPRAIFEALWVTGRGLGFLDLIAEHGAAMDPGLARLGQLSLDYSLRDYYGFLSARREFNSAMYRFLAGFDVLLMPTMPITAFGAEDEVPPGGEADAALPWITWTPYTYAFNITGQPAITVPCGLAADGMPVGLQVVGSWADDDTVLAAAELCEQIIDLPSTQRFARVG